MRDVKPAWSEVITVVLLMTQVFWDVTVSGSDVHKDHSAVKTRVKQWIPTP